MLSGRLLLRRHCPQPPACWKSGSAAACPGLQRVYCLAYCLTLTYSTSTVFFPGPNDHSKCCFAPFFAGSRKPAESGVETESLLNPRVARAAPKGPQTACTCPGNESKRTFTVRSCVSGSTLPMTDQFSTQLPFP